jgi:carbon-monoxide dehydrogenase small subunit
MRTTMTVNGDPVDADVEPRTLLVDLVRDVLGLTGTKVGCDTAQCGSCLVKMDGRAVKSCSVLAVQADGAEVATIEGIGADGALTAVQQALWEQHGVQCGFCTPGVVISLLELLERNPHPGEDDIRSWLTGNICRCTGYHSIVRAAVAAAQAESSAAHAAS